LDFIPLEFRPFSPRKKKEIIQFFRNLSEESRRMYTSGSIDPEELYLKFRDDWKNNTNILVYHRRRLIGLVRLCQERNIGEIEGIAVDEEFQGKGVGTRIVKYITALAILNGIEKLRAEVKRENRKSYRLFSHLGFRVVKRGPIITLERKL